MTHSALADKLLLQWSAGLIAALMVQQFAHAATLDGANHPELVQLAALGNYGKCPGNCSRDLTKLFLESSKVPAPTLISTMAVDPKTGHAETVDVPCFLPHLMFHSLQFYDQFDDIFGVDKLGKFWQGVQDSGDPRLPHYRFEEVSPNWKQQFIPCFIHGDGVPFQTRDSLMIFSWGSLLTLLSTVDCSLLLSGFPKSCTIKDGHQHETWKDIWTWIVWSFEAAFTGFHPRKDPFNKPFSKGSAMLELAGKPLHPKQYKLCIWVLEGDHEHFSNMLDLPHWSSDLCCWSCNTRASCPRLTWKTLKRRDDGWKMTTVEESMAIANQHAFFYLRGVSRLTVGHDGLHVIFCKGVLSYFLGGCLHTMLWPSRGRQANSPQSRLNMIFARVQELYSQSNSTTRLTNLKMEMICNPDKPWAEVPFLKVKGAECKHLLPIMTIISSELSTHSPHDNHRTRALELITEFCVFLDSKDMFLTAAEADHVVQLIDDFLEEITWLNDWAKGQDRLSYHYTIKFHMLQHLALASRYLNPRYYWCFKAEDNVGKLAVMAHSVSMGVKSTKLAINFCNKWREFLHFRFTRGCNED